MFSVVTAAAAPPPPPKRKCPSKACICAVLTVWLFIAFIVMTVCCFVYLKPLFKIIRYKETRCRVENSFYVRQYVCRCGSGWYSCLSTYPCYLIHVSVNNTDGQQWVVSLYLDDEQQSTIIDVSTEEQEWCSLKVCHEDAEQNRQDVTNFERQYGQYGSSVPCAYDPMDISAGAVLEVVPPGMATFHALFWPFLCLFLGVLICVVFCRRCRKADDKKAADAATAAGAGEAKSGDALLAKDNSGDPLLVKDTSGDPLLVKDASRDEDLTVVAEVDTAERRTRLQTSQSEPVKKPSKSGLARFPFIQKKGGKKGKTAARHRSMIV